MIFPLLYLSSSHAVFSFFPPFPSLLPPFFYLFIFLFRLFFSLPISPHCISALHPHNNPNSQRSPKSSPSLRQTIISWKWIFLLLCAGTATGKAPSLPCWGSSHHSSAALEKLQIYGLAAAKHRVDGNLCWEVGKQEGICLLSWAQGSSLLFEICHDFRTERLSLTLGPAAAGIQVNEDEWGCNSHIKEVFVIFYILLSLGSCVCWHWEMAQGVWAGRWDVWGDQCSQPGTGTAESQHSCRNPGKTLHVKGSVTHLDFWLGLRGEEVPSLSPKPLFSGTFTATKAWT